MSGRRWLLFSGLALIAGALIGPRLVPLYDGVGFPDQPYQFVRAGGQTDQSPSPVEQTVPKADLSQYTTTLQSLESGPQVRVIFDPNALAVPRAASEVQLTATPEAPSAQPSSGSIASNVYLITGTSSPGSPTVNNSLANVFLRLPQGVTFKTGPTMIYRPAGGAWKQLQTERTGQDIYVAPFDGWGEYALAINMAVQTSPNAAAGRPAARNNALVIAGAVVGLMVVLIIAIRLRSPDHNDPTKNK